jgi:hypothetical protein
MLEKRSPLQRQVRLLCSQPQPQNYKVRHAHIHRQLQQLPLQQQQQHLHHRLQQIQLHQLRRLQQVNVVLLKGLVMAVVVIKIIMKSASMIVETTLFPLPILTAVLNANARTQFRQHHHLVRTIGAPGNVKIQKRKHCDNS